MDISEYLQSQGIDVSLAKVNITLADFNDAADVSWTPFAKVKDQDSSLEDGQLAMSLASMAAVHILNAQPNEKVLDVCAAPGIKGLYANKLTDDLQYYVNDLSADRLARLVRLHKRFGIFITNMTKYDARFIDRAYDSGSFDKIILDAPCSGEGVALAGDKALEEAWSAAKVKRLQQLQIKILKSSWKLLRPGGRLVYATCTLNKNENERVIHKALGIDVKVRTGELSLKSLPVLKHAHAWRILPSPNSIGFFIAVLEKSTLDDI